MNEHGATFTRGEARIDTLVNLARIEHEHGKAYAGLVIEGVLEACGAYLRGSVGAEAAFNIIQRRADELTGPVISEQAARSQS